MIPVLILAVIAGGALIAAQGPIYTRMAGMLGGPVQAAMLAFAVGAVALLALLTAVGGPFPRRADMAAVPLWVWAGGLIGVYVVLTSILAVPRLGVASYMVCVIVGQLAAGYAYDRFGAFGMAVREFSAANLAGLAMVAAGAVLVVWR
ncbi:DMT family transporter [Ruegeria sediminis]|uniref:DMT family transporter n=1 Tax=Ruegeria sediminis TaxID=2583820 RepID=A0ABY2WUQ0_9RHOB|nr:DMT family transporter [Ruegeria sediminis]TMV04784.1 DMT family transporter [Ruegeria sediminis]